MTSQNRRLTMKDKHTKYPQLRFKGFTDSWEQRKLGELGKIYTGNTPKTSDLDNWTDNKEGHIWITPTDIDKLIMSDSDRHLSEQGWSKARKIPENSVLITSIASIGKNAINAVPVAFNQQINAIVPEKNDSYFILSAMIKDTARFASVAGQTATAIINKTTFEKYQIATPSYEEQQKIGAFFKQLDDTITLHQRKLAKLKKLKQGYLQKMFPKNGSKFPQLRFAGFADAWEQRKLGEVADIFDGTHQTPKYTDSGVKFVSVENIGTLETKKYISQEAYENEYSKKQAEKGDVLMTRIGDIGTSKEIESNESLAYYVTLALLKTKEIDSNFLARLIASPEVQRDIWKRTLHIAFPKKINLGEINQVKVNVALLEEQKQIGTFFKQLDETITLHQRKLEKLQELKKGYLQKMFC